MTPAKSVLLLGNHPPPFGGVPSHIRSFSPYLAARGWEVHVLSLAGRSAPEERLEGYTVHRPPRVRRWADALLQPAQAARYARTCPELARRDPRMFFGCVAAAQAARAVVRQHPVALISAYHVLAAGLAGAWLAEELGVPLVITNFGEVYAEPARFERLADGVRHALARSARLVSCSRHCARSYERLGITDPVETVYYGVDVERFAPRPAGPARRALGFEEGDEVALFVGRMVEEMGLGTLLAAVPAVLAARPAARFVIAGARGHLTDRAEEVARAHAGRVTVMVNVPDAKMPDLYAAASVGVAPSANERACLGLAIAEAMATARPVIGARVGGTPEVVRDGESGELVPPNDPAALAESIARVLADPARAAGMGRHGRAFVEATLSKDATNRAMERIFEEALAGVRAGS